MAFLKITDYILDYRPGSTGIVFFITSDGIKRSTPELQPQIFAPLCTLLQRPSAWDSDGKGFRNIVQQQSNLKANTKHFLNEDFDNLDKFETWSLPNEN